MNRGNWSDLIALLEGAKRGLHFGEGLSDAGVQRAEESYGVRILPDLRAFLQTALPLGSPFPNWRIADDPLLGRQKVLFYTAFFLMSRRMASGFRSGVNGRNNWTMPMPL
jgi:hypothetical protein